MEEGSGVRLLLAVLLILWIPSSGIGGSLAGGVLESGGEEENKGLLLLRGARVVATTWYYEWEGIEWGGVEWYCGGGKS